MPRTAITGTAVLACIAMLAACAGQRRAEPSPVRAPVDFRVLGNASPSDTGPPTLRIDGQRVAIRGLGIQVEGGGLYGDVDLTEPHTLRLTLYDSLPGRPVNDPPPRLVYRQVIYEAWIGPLAPGPYDVWVGRFDAKARMVEVAHEPLRIQVEAAPAPRDSADTPAKE
jgi:hypothetical protein